MAEEADRTVDQVLSGLTDVSLTVRLLDDEYVLIEGDEKSLLGLAEILRAQAQARSPDCGVQIAPRGAGSAHFAGEATHGLYVHRLPCSHSPSDP